MKEEVSILTMQAGIQDAVDETVVVPAQEPTTEPEQEAPIAVPEVQASLAERLGISRDAVDDAVVGVSNSQSAMAAALGAEVTAETRLNLVREQKIQANTDDRVARATARAAVDAAIATLQELKAGL